MGEYGSVCCSSAVRDGAVRLTRGRLELKPRATGEPGPRGTEPLRVGLWFLQLHGTRSETNPDQLCLGSRKSPLQQLDLSWDTNWNILTNSRRHQTTSRANFLFLFFGAISIQSPWKQILPSEFFLKQRWNEGPPNPESQKTVC